MTSSAPVSSDDASGLSRATALKSRIMVIDDELGFRELMVFELGSRGYEVLVAANGEEAVRKISGQSIDVVVSDMTMPGKGGLDALKAIKSLDPLIEVIMVTGYATLEDAVESMKRGAYDFITKPFQVDDLARLIDRASEKRRLSRKVDELREKLRSIDGGRPASRSVPDEPPRSVLVVDDEMVIVEYLGETLRAAGYAVEAAAGGKEALERLSAGRPPDILFLDLMMPEVSGFDVIEAVDRNPGLKNMLIIILTAKHLTPQETDYLHKHVAVIIQKGSKSLPEILAIVKNRLRAVENAQ